MTTPFTDEEQRLLQLLDQNPAFRQEVRRRLLPEELLSLPELLATLTTNVNGFVEQRLAANARSDPFIEQQLATNSRLEGLCDSTDQRIAAVINGGAIQPPLLSQAERMGVRVVILAMFRQQTQTTASLTTRNDRGVAPPHRRFKWSCPISSRELTPVST